MAILGNSGSGKSSLLDALSGGMISLSKETYEIIKNIKVPLFEGSYWDLKK